MTNSINNAPPTMIGSMQMNAKVVAACESVRTPYNPEIAPRAPKTVATATHVFGDLAQRRVISHRRYRE
jgi:PP-loop superfamily ATP-utilizing enzyme